MGAAAESLTLEKDTSAGGAGAGAQQVAPVSSAFDPFVQRIFGAAPPDPPDSVANSLSVQRLKAPVLQRAQRLYGNRASQQIVMRARAVQRQCACGGTCAKCQAEEQQRLGMGSSPAPGPAQSTLQSPVQRSSEAHAPAGFDGIPATAGEQLDPASRQPMEAHFGADLADVRVHTGSEAAKSATSLDALAYTSGRDIYFASGMYAPSSDSGRRLLAHEVAHVVQQSSGKEPTLATKSSQGARIGAPDDPLETEADRAAEEFMAGPLTDEEERKKREARNGGSSNALQRFIQRQEVPPGSAPNTSQADPQRSSAATTPNDSESGSSAPAATWLKPLPTNVTLHPPPAPAFAELGSVLTGHPYIKEIPTPNEDELRQVARANDYFESSPLGTFETASGEYLEERNKLTDLFEVKAYHLVLYELTQSELQAGMEQFRYADTGNSNNPEIDQLRQAATHLAQVQQEIMSSANDPIYMEMNAHAPRAYPQYLDDYIDTPALWRPDMESSDSSLEKPDSEEKAYHEYSVEIFKKTIQRYKSLREIYGERFPILLPRNQDYYTLAKFSSDDLAKYVYKRSVDVLNSIQDARSELFPSKIWSLPVIIDQTKTLLGIEEGTGANDAIENKLDDMAFGDHRN